MQRDGAGHQYEEISYPNGDSLRLTLIPDSTYGGRSIRVQAHDVSGRLFPGPEIPANNLAEVVAAMQQLIVA